MRLQPTSSYAQLNARIMPVARGRRFETPLMEALAENGFGEVGGGGTMQLGTGEIEYCGIDVDLFNVENGAPFVCKFLTDRGARGVQSFATNTTDKRLSCHSGSLKD